MPVKITINESASRKVVGDAIEKFMVGQVAPYVTRTVQNNIQLANRIDTGRMINSVELKESRRLARGGHRITIGSSLEYTAFQEFGTGPWIYPRRSKFLRFKPKGSGVFVFARRVRGVTPMNAFRRAVQSFNINRM